jgi:hypothetical protein
MLHVQINICIAVNLLSLYLKLFILLLFHLHVKLKKRKIFLSLNYLNPMPCTLVGERWYSFIILDLGTGWR